MNDAKVSRSVLESSGGGDPFADFNFEGTPTFDHYMGLKFYLEDLLGTKVDLVEKAMPHPSIRSTVEGEVISVA